MKKIYMLAALSMLLAGQFAWAGRALPDTVRLARLEGVDYPKIVLSRDGLTWTQVLTLGLVTPMQATEAQGNIRIRDSHNRFITHNKLNRHIGEAVGVFYTRQGEVKEIWLLTEQERQQLKARGQ